MAENRVRIIIDLPPEQAVQGVGKIVDAMDGLGATVTRAGKEADAALSSTMAKTKELASQGKVTADTLEAAYQKLGMRSGNAIRADIAETVAAYKKLASSGATSGRDLEAALTATKSRVADLRRELSRVKEVDSLKAQVRQAQQFGAELGNLEALARTAGTAIVSYLSVRGLADMAADIMAVGMQFDALRNSLKTASGDSATAAADFAFVSSEAKRLGLELLSTGQAYAQLKNASKGTALEGQETEKIFSAVAEASRALHLTSDQTSGALLSLQQMMSKGTVQAEELRGQLGERLPGAFNLAAQAMGVTTSELGKMLEQGQVLAVDLLPKLAEAMHQAYGAGAAEAATSAAAEMERLKNAVAEYKDMVYTAFSEELAGAIRSTNSLLSENKESVNLYLLGIKGYAAGAAAEIKKVGDEAGISAGKVMKAAEAIARFIPGLKTVMMVKDFWAGVGDAVQSKGQDTAQQKELTTLLGEIEDIAKNGQKSSLKSYSQDEFNKMMGLAPSYDSSKLMSGVPLSALSKLQKAWSDIVPKIAQVNKDISSGNLQGTGLEKALQDRAKLYDGLTIAQGDYQKSLTKGSKAEANAAVAAERYGEQASAYLIQAQDQYAQLVAQLEGDPLSAKLAAIDRQYNSAAASISRSMIGAKGSTEAARAALEQLEKNRAVAKKIAEADAWKKSMQDAANMLGELGRLSGDPNALYASSMTTAQTWEADQKKRINALQDEAEKTKQLGELQQVMALKELEARKQAYEDLAGVSSEYFDAEKQRIEQHLAIVKQNATDERAYKIYEAQQWDAYNKALLEKQEQYASSFAEVLSAKWALTYGTYKSAATQAQAAWEQTAQSIVDATNNVVDSIVSGVGDMVRGFGDGTTSIESLFQSLKSRAISIFASMIEEMLRRWLNDFVGRLDIGSLFGSSSSSSSTGSGISLSNLTGSAGSGSSGSISSGLSGLKSLGDYIGKATGGSFADSLASTTSDIGVVIGDAPDIGKSIGKELSQYGDVWNAGSDMWSTGESFASSFSSAASTASSLSSVLSSTLGVVGAVGAVAGLVTSLFSSSEKTEKTGSGYKIAINAGTLNMSGVDFYKTTTQSAMGGTSTSNFSVDTGMVDPDVAKAVNDALKEAAENLHDFGKVLGITTGDLLAGLTMPEMTITDGQMDSYIRNTSNVMAFQALDNSGLRGAFDAVAERYEVYVDEFSRLADAYQLVGGYTEAYGYDLETLAGITADDIASIRQINTETAEGTSQAILSMASAMGATSDQLAELAANANDGSAALAVTDQQLSKILQADYASQLEDAVGGEDAFQTLMQNLVKNVLNSVEAYQEQASYYTDKANQSLQELGASGVTIDNFWQRFDAAMHGALSVDDFEKWADAAGWVNALNTISDALDSWATTVHQAYQALDVRALKAQGLDYQADLTETLASAEQELTAARAAGYDAAYLARLAEVQALEYAAKIAQHAEDYAKELRDAQKRYATAIDDNSSLIAIQMAENAAELADLAKTYNWSVGSAEEALFQTLQKAQWAELIAQIRDSGDAITQATEAMQRDLEARKATLAGYDAEAEALQKVAGFADELTQAYEDGVDDSLLADLMQVQIDELAKYWSDTLDSMKSDLQDLYKSQSDLMDTLNGSTQTAMQELQALFVRYKAGETDLADQIIESLQSIASAVDSMVNDIHDTIYKIRTGEDYTTDSANVVADNALAYYNEQLAKAASGDTDAMGSIGTYATSYLDAVKSSTADESVYASARDYVTSTLSSLASGASSGTSGLSDIAQTVTDDQIAKAELAIKQAEVAQRKTQYDTLWAQAVAAFQGSKYGSLVAQMATTAVGWSGGVGNLLSSDYWDGGTNSMRAADAILSGSGGMTSAAYVGWYLTNYGAGTGYVDWSGALSQWVTSSQATWPSVAALPSDVMSLYSQAMSAYSQWQALKSTYGFDAGGVIVSDSAWGDNTLVRANDAERVLTPSQNEAFEEIAFGRGNGELVSVLIARMDRLADKVDQFRAESGQWNRIKTRKLSSMDARQDDWAVTGSLQVGVKGTVTVDGKVEVAS
ncbi:tape measure protein [Desulfovibrio sp. JY]|nr:tape measure protein [Desulfovibrio sp. JY]